MSTNSQKNTEEKEIDLASVSNKIGGIYQGLNDGLFSIIQFLIKNVIVLIILFILGVGLGLYLDKTNKIYDHEVVVEPNFGSSDYLYAKIDLLESKIREKDTVFLKAIGIQEPKKLVKIEIKPILGIYDFVNNSGEKNFELLKLMSQDNDINKIVEDNTTSKNYKYHKISLQTRKYTSNKKTIEPILKYLNNSDFFKKIQVQTVSNVYIKIKANETIVNQIDGFLNGFTNNPGSPKSDKLVYYNENSPLKDVIETKDRLVRELGYQRISLLSFDKIVKEVSQTINMENDEAANGKLKLILPFLFILIFILLKLFISFYKIQSSKRKQITV